MAAIHQMMSFMGIALVVSSTPKAYALVRARRYGLRSYVMKKAAVGKGLDWRDIDKVLREQRIDKIFLAGFMRVLPADFITGWQGKVFNIHPSLLPSYPGLHSIERAYADHAPIGMTVHEVNEEVDAGQKLLQRKVFDRKTGFPEFARAEFMVHVSEHRLVQKVMQKMSSR